MAYNYITNLGGHTNVRVRSGAGTSYSIVTTIADSSTVFFFDRDHSTNSWHKVELFDGTKGWIRNDLFDTTGQWAWLDDSLTASINKSSGTSFSITWSKSSYAPTLVTPKYYIEITEIGSVDSNPSSPWSRSEQALFNEGYSYGAKLSYRVVGYVKYDTNYYTVSPWVEFTFSPTISKQPSITQLNPSTGSSSTITYSAATGDFGSATIKYQYFVGPQNTYSDSYHVGTTTSTSVTISESNIISKCGAGYGASSSGSKCYFYVRAYWEYGQKNGGWTTPSPTTFTYQPSIGAPTGLTLSHTSGQSVVIKWSNTTVGNGSSAQTFLIIDGVVKTGDISGSSAGINIAETTWAGIGRGGHNIQLRHEYYGRYADTSALTFTYLPIPYSPTIVLNYDEGNTILYRITDNGASDGGSCEKFKLTINSYEFGWGTGTYRSVSESHLINISKEANYNRVFTLKLQSAIGDLASEPATTTFTYIPTLTPPANFKVNGATDAQGTSATFTWSAATLADGDTNISYKLYKDNVAYTTVTGTQKTFNEEDIIKWDTLDRTEWIIVATAAGAIEEGDTVYFTYKPILTPASNLKIHNADSYTGSSADLAWVAGFLSSGKPVTQKLLVNEAEDATAISGTTLLIAKDVAKQWKGQTITFKIRTFGANQQADSNAVTYIFKPDAKTIWYMGKEYYVYTKINGVPKLCDWFVKT